MAAIHHIALNCRDRVAQQRFYCDLLGFRLVRRWNPDTPGEFTMIRLGECCLELFPGGPDARGGEQPVGFKHLALEVVDIQAKTNELKAAGVPVGEIIDVGGNTPNLRIMFFADPEGNVLELMECPTDDPEL